MLRTVSISIVLLLTAGAAHADDDRATALSVTGGYGILGDIEDATVGPMIGATLAWDRAPPEIPRAPGYAWAGDLVPEVTLMRAAGEAILMAGVRVEADFAQREQGLLRVDGRGSVWLAPRVAVTLDGGQPFAGGEFGASLQIGRTGWSWGYWFGFLGGHAEPARPVEGSLALVPDGALYDQPPAEPVLLFLAGLTLSRAY